MKIDTVAHKAAVDADNERRNNLKEGYELIRVGQHSRVVNNEIELYFDWLEWLNFHVDRLIRPIRFKLSESVYNANPEYWAEVFRYGRYLPAWVVSLIMRVKCGKDSLL